MLGVVFSAFIILVFATWTTNSVNLYSTTLAVAVILPKLSEWKLMIFCAIFGTSMAVAGLADYFITFLEWLGVIVPPIAGVYLTDYFLLKRTVFDLDSLEKVEDYDKAALVAWVAATVISVLAFWFAVSMTGIASLDALLITIPLYLLCLKVWPTRFERTQGHSL